MSFHMFQFFINALNVQNEEIRSLYDKVTNLKKTIISKSLHSSSLENAVIKHTEELNSTLMSTNPVMIYERRRRELFRTNQRIVSNPSYCSEDFIEHCAAKHITCHQSKSPSSVQLKSECQKIMPADSLLQFSDINFMGLSNNSVTHFYDPEKSNANESSMNDCSISCPCGNRQNCPLSEQKIERLCKDPCIAHGFTILSAIFRGRFIRQLLATHKVCGLIRTVKDTAKLALSLRLERQSSIQQIRMPQCEFLSTNQPIQLSEQELLLESRLLTQLRSALNQIHEIFFQWPISNQISLVSTSHSPKISQKSIKEIEHSSTSNPVISSHKSTVGCSPTGWNSQTLCMVNRRILRQLQPHQVNCLSRNKQFSENISKEGKKQSASISADMQFKQNIRCPTECKPIIRAKKQRIQSEDKCRLDSNSKTRTSAVSQFNVNKTESCRRPSASPTTHSIISSPEYKSEGKSNSRFVKSSSKQLSKLSGTSASKTHTLSSKSSPAAVTSKISNFSNSPNTGTTVTSSVGNNLIQTVGDSTKPIKPKIIRHFSSKLVENKSIVDSSTVNSELGTNSELETNFGTDLNNFSNLKINNPDKYHVNYPILSQYENIVHAPSIVDDNNNAPGQACFPVKRRILSRKLQNNDSNVFINLTTHNISDYNKYSDTAVESFLSQDNQSMNNTLCCNDDKVTNNHYNNSELRTTWTFDSKTQPSLIIDTTNLTD
ncbi:centriolar coiled-coil domain-containing protein isoform 2 [Schistosoma japonicum]|uniref:Centriolar coiled-coil domain-containing protein isoform 2 n=2 Tax=Schistosoma japonicum TaxID=6182 RepID=A0A4Z2D756_SCHJA|nr:centriolar coiled-coil domain-containing protein isoform 2 [Schistosoma japonicum]